MQTLLGIKASNEWLMDNNIGELCSSRESCGSRGHDCGVQAYLRLRSDAVQFVRQGLLS
jgi:hypothetical protein